MLGVVNINAKKLNENLAYFKNIQIQIYNFFESNYPPVLLDHLVPPYFYTFVNVFGF
jgi:hypothetical protein